MRHFVFFLSLLSWSPFLGRIEVARTGRTVTCSNLLGGQIPKRRRGHPSGRAPPHGQAAAQAVSDAISGVASSLASAFGSMSKESNNKAGRLTPRVVFFELWRKKDRGGFWGIDSLSSWTLKTFRVWTILGPHNKVCAFFGQSTQEKANPNQPTRGGAVPRKTLRFFVGPMKQRLNV